MTYLQRSFDGVAVDGFVAKRKTSPNLLILAPKSSARSNVPPLYVSGHEKTKLWEFKVARPCLNSAIVA